MKVDIPEYKRCCLCIQLRHGLLVWGYMKLIFNVVTFVSATNIVIDSRYRGPASEVWILYSIMAVCMLNILFAIVFVTGGHLKSSRLLKIFYYYSITEAVLIAIGYLVQLSFLIHWMINVPYRSFISHIFGATRDQSACLLVILLIQFYVICLIRSEILKLENNMQVRITNVGAEAECNIVTGKQVEPLEKDPGSGDVSIV